MKALRVVLMLLLAVAVLSSLSFARVDKGLIINGPHDLRATGAGGVSSGVLGPSYALCNYCHVAHKLASDAQYGGLGANGAGVLLWNHTLSPATTYTVYSSWTLQSKPNSLQTTGNINADLNNPSILCMSCHDGTVAINSTYTGIVGPGFGSSPVYFSGANLQYVINPSDANKTHPVDMVYDTALATAAGMKPPAGPLGVDVNTTNAVVPLFKGGYMECSTCHEPHSNQHLLFRNFAAVYTATNGSWCLYCHSDGSKSIQ